MDGQGAAPRAISPAARPALPVGAGAALAYLLAALFGAGLALWTFPPDFLLPRAGAAWMPLGDAAQHMVAQRHFLRDAWHWPPLHVATLNAPDGINLAFADGIPLLALPLKLLAPWLPAGFHGIGLWYGLAWVAMPLAGVWALRGTGETRLLPLLAMAVAAASMPSFLARVGHAALCGQFLLLLGLGTYLRLVRRPSATGWAGAAALLVVALLAHPYLAAMVLAVLGAVPLTLLLRGDRRWRGAALGLLGAAAALAATMAGLGYLGATGDGGYGQFALNLASPFWPYRSGLLPPLVAQEVDATGHGGWEGYNWLGLGLLLGLAAAAALGGQGSLWRLARRHAGLTLALAGLTALAVSFRVGFVDNILLDLGRPPAVLEQFRASGRFFWPVGFALLLGCAAILARCGRQGLVALVALAGLQFADAAPWRVAARDWAARQEAWPLDAPALRDALAGASRLTLLPSWACLPVHGADAEKHLLLAVLAMASERPVPVNTMYVARWRQPPRCQDAVLAAAPLAPGELRVVVPSAHLPDGAWPEACRVVGNLRLCRGP